MNKEDTVNVIEMIAKAIYEHDLPDGDEWKSIKEGRKYFYQEAAQRILDLCYPCAECKGRGQRDAKDTDAIQGIYLCPVCHGTGKGSKVLAILDENQTLPECADKRFHGSIAYLRAQQDMIKAGWRKTVC